MIPTHVISENPPEILSSLDLRLLLRIPKFVLETVASDRSSLCTQRWITAALLVTFRPSCM